MNLSTRYGKSLLSPVYEALTFSETTVVLLRSGVCLVLWPFHIHIRFWIAQHYLRSCINVYPTSLIQIEFLTFHQGLSVTGHAVPILLVSKDYIAEVLDSTGTYFGFKIPSL